VPVAFVTDPEHLRPSIPVTNLLVQLSIFLIDLFVGTYRLSSHARLEAFVIQTKLFLL